MSAWLSVKGLPSSIQWIVDCASRPSVAVPRMRTAHGLPAKIQGIAFASVHQIRWAVYRWHRPQAASILQHRPVYVTVVGGCAHSYCNPKRSSALTTMWRRTRLPMAGLAQILSLNRAIPKMEPDALVAPFRESECYSITVSSMRILGA